MKTKKHKATKTVKTYKIENFNETDSTFTMNGREYRFEAGLVTTFYGPEMGVQVYDANGDRIWGQSECMSPRAMLEMFAEQSKGEDEMTAAYMKMSNKSPFPVTSDFVIAGLYAQLARHARDVQNFHEDPITEAYGIGGEFQPDFDRKHRKLCTDLATRAAVVGDKAALDLAHSELECYMP